MTPMLTIPARVTVLSSALALALGCGPAEPPAPAPQTASGPGTLEVQGTGQESYSLRDSHGNHITSVPTGARKELAAGEYSVALGNVAPVVVRAGEVTTFALGTLAVSGTGQEGYSLRDSAGTHVTTVSSSTVKELVPGAYSVVLGNAAPVTVQGGAETRLALGTLAVSGTGAEGYSLRDSAGVHVTTVSSNAVKELVPGAYSVVLGNSAAVNVQGGAETRLALGTLVARGTGKEGYSLRDSGGVHVTTVWSNAVKELVPGVYSVVLGNVAEVTIQGGAETSLALGILVAGSAGGGTVGLSDGQGQHVTTLQAGAEKELVPGRYTLAFGERDIEVQVAAGETTTFQP